MLKKNAFSFGVPQGMGLGPLLFSPQPYTDSGVQQTLYCIPTTFTNNTCVKFYSVRIDHIGKIRGGFLKISELEEENTS